MNCQGVTLLKTATPRRRSADPGFFWCSKVGRTDVRLTGNFNVRLQDSSPFVTGKPAGSPITVLQVIAEARPARRAGATSVDVEVESLIQAWEGERPEIPMGSLRVSLPLRRALQHAEAQRSKVLAKHGVSAATLDLLVALRRSGKPYVSTPSELGRLLVLSSGGVSQRLERLEREGLVERQVSVADRRVVYVHLTEAGLQTLDRLIEEYMAHEEQMLSGLSARQASLLGQLLLRLDASIAASAK